MSKTTPLSLRIDYLGRSSEFLLQVNTPFFIGRAAETDLQIDADSISMKHLELLWDASVLRVRDLESSNGSFRMPQDSPFLEALFAPREREINLKLAKTLITISWKNPDEESHERTEVLDLGATPPHTVASSISPSLDSPESMPQTLSSASKKAQASEAGAALSRWSRPLFLAGVFVGAVQNFFFFSQNTSLLSAKASWALGPAIDFYILWLADLPVFAGVWALGLVLAFLLKLRLEAIESNLRTRSLGLAGMLLMASVLVWPAVFLKSSGNPKATQHAVAEFRNLQDASKTHDFGLKEKNIEFSSKLSDLSTPLKGSSIFYAFWHNFQKKRVVDECGGVGDGSWEKKRVCLVLLFALSMDGYTSIRPVFLGPTASSLVFLSSLDGVVRVLAAEGPASESIKLFISTLDDVGLKQEAKDFVTLVEGFRGQNFDDLMHALLELRLSIEKKIFDAQSDPALPPSFKLNLMGPLEMGI
ncbi:MAG: FHA domain-containing protein [Bdellovibrionota bacterium]